MTPFILKIITLKKVYSQILKKSSPISLLIHFSNISKKHTYKIPKKPDTIFCLYPFSSIKKVYLQNLKKPDTISFLIPFSNITNLTKHLFLY